MVFQDKILSGHDVFTLCLVFKYRSSKLSACFFLEAACCYRQIPIIYKQQLLSTTFFSFSTSTSDRDFDLNRGWLTLPPRGFRPPSGKFQIIRQGPAGRKGWGPLNRANDP